MISDKQETILLTGSTGTLGSKILKEILKSNKKNIVLLVRGYSNEEALNRVKQIVNLTNTGGVEVYSSDITKPFLDLNKNLYIKLTERITTIIHCAGNVRFSTPLKEARLINYHGTVNLVNFAKKCKNFRKFGHVSTAFVAGRRKGRVQENDLEHKSGFVNYYEQSKYEAEIFVRRNFNELPINIFRPTILLDTESKNAISYMITLYSKGKLPFIPGDKNGYVDIVSADHCAFSIWKILNNYFNKGKTYHIATGPKQSYTLDKLVSRVVKSLPRNKGLEKPRFINLNSFQAILIQKLARTQLEIFKRLNTFATQLVYPKIFETKNLEALGDDKIKPIPIDKYFDTYLENFLRTKV